MPCRNEQDRPRTQYCRLVPQSDLWDLVIIGAGPAGTTAAIAALAQDPHLRVLIADKATFPRDKACGDGLGPGVVSVLRELGLERIVADEAPIDGCAVFGPDETGFESDLPTIKGQTIVGYVVPRYDFDARLLAAAQAAGAELQEGWRFEGLTQLHTEVELAFHTGSGTHTVRAKAVVGADGANSRVRAALRVARNSDRLTGIAIRAYADSRSSSPQRRLVFEWSERLLPAYAWYFPASNGTVNIGLGLVVRDRKRRKIDLGQHLASFVQVLESRGVYVDNVRLERTYILPHGARLPRLAHGRVMLIGDAGSMINPLSGEGIFYGMAAGSSVGRQLAASLHNGDVVAGLKRAEREFRRRFLWHFRSNYAASVMLRSRTWAKVVIRAAARDKKVLAAGVELLFGEGVITPSTTARILRSGLRPTRRLRNDV